MPSNGEGSQSLLEIPRESLRRQPPVLAGSAGVVAREGETCAGSGQSQAEDARRVAYFQTSISMVAGMAVSVRASAERRRLSGVRLCHAERSSRLIAFPVGAGGVAECWARDRGPSWVCGWGGPQVAPSEGRQENWGAGPALAERVQAAELRRKIGWWQMSPPPATAAPVSRGSE